MGFRDWHTGQSLVSLFCRKATEHLLCAGTPSQQEASAYLLSGQGNQGLGEGNTHQDMLRPCVTLPSSSPLRGQVWGSARAPARSGCVKVLTLCLHGLGVPEKPAHQPGGHCPVERGQETRSCSLQPHQEAHGPVYTPGRSSGESGKLAEPQRNGPAARGLVGVTGQPGWESMWGHQ